jgi:hypothetical protein
MGRYTIYNDAKIDEAVNKDLNFIVRYIISKIAVRNIILGGGFGRGEGSVIIDGENIYPVNDYDFFLIVPDNFECDLRSFSMSIAKKIGIRLIDLIPIKESMLNSLPNAQIFYDLKHGGQVLWGENVLDLIPDFKVGYVDISSAKTLLLNRLICAIEAYSDDFNKRRMSKEETFFLVNQTSKVVLACVEAMLIKNSKYHHKYKERQKIFIREYPNKIELQKLNEFATEFKLKPSRSANIDPLKYWKRTIKQYLVVLSEHVGCKKIDLWSALKKTNKENNITNHPIERIELMTLLYRHSSFLLKRSILKRANFEFCEITGEHYLFNKWECLRENTAKLWHKLYH